MSRWTPVAPPTGHVTSTGTSRWTPVGPAPKKKHHGSFFDKIPGSKIASQTVKDLESVAIHSPGGLYELGKGTVQDVNAAAHGNYSFKHSRAMGTAMAKSTLEDLRHPLRHPGLTALDIWGLASAGAGTAARAGALGKALAEGDAAAIARAAVKRPAPGVRRIGGQQALYSRNALTRRAQKLLDQARERFPETPILGRREASAAGFEGTENRRVSEALARAPGSGLMAAGKKLSASEQYALRIVAEGKSIPERIAFHATQLAGKFGRSKRAHAAQIKDLEAAAQHIDYVDGKPVLKDARLQGIYDQAKNVAAERQRVLEELGFLNPENAAGRISAPGQVVEGTFDAAKAARIAEKDQIPGHLALVDLVPELFGGGDFRVPYTSRAASKALDRALGYRGGVPRAPASVRKMFEGGLLKAGFFRNDTTRLVAESYMEAERFAALLRARDELVHLASDSPEAIPQQFRQAIRLDSLKNKSMPTVIRDFLQRPEELHGKTNPAHWRMFGNAYEAMRNEIFPDMHDVASVPGVKWIDKRLLGGLNEKNPLVGIEGNATGRRWVSAADAINNASRMAILYLKPSYAVPNLLGNLAMNLLQQGFAAPRNLVNAARLSNKLGPEDAALLDSLMGEGFVKAISGDRGVGQSIINKSADFWSKGVDVPFRRASFLHEAHVAGFKTSAQLKALLHDPAHGEALTDITRRANREIIDYARMGPIEKEIIRRVIFFYPWVKGSTMYSARFVAEHPLKAAAVGALGQRGEETQKRDLGDLPSFAEDLIKTGGSSANPTVISPSSFSIFETPASVAIAAKQGLLGNTTPAHELASFLSPVGGAELAALSRHGALGHTYPSKTSPVKIFAEELIHGTPQYSAYRRWTHPNDRKATYPYTHLQTALNYGVFGGLTPHTARKRKLNKRAREEKKGSR